MNRILNYIDFDILDYSKAWKLQKEIFDLRLTGRIEDTLILLQHPHTYTLGKTANRNHLISNTEFLRRNRIAVYDIDRGGDITYHGPGQIVGYPIINLTNWKQDTHKYLRALEEVIIRTCLEYNLDAGRISDYTGVWIKERKIAAIGIKVSRWVTMHGFAFNISTDLNFFNGIIPCGISDKAVTSLEAETGLKISISDVKVKLLNNFKIVFSYDELSEVGKEFNPALSLSHN